MLKPITDLSGTVVGFEAIGKVEADDYRNVLDPAVAKAVEAHGSVRLLLVLGDEYEGYAPGAMWQDTKVGLSDRKVWERIAVVSDHNRLTGALHLFAGMFPGELRTYPMDQLDEAKTWLGEATT
jgi:hypothetical protein